MAATFSFDIVSEVNLQEVDNAVNQARRVLAQRYDFKGSKSSIELQQKERQIILLSDDDFKLKSVLDILHESLIRRGVPIKALDYGPIEPAAGGTVRQVIRLRIGIARDDARTILKLIKDSKIKAQAQIMDDQIRVSGKSKDDLQAVIALVKGADLPFAVQFTNYR
ncbi:MAG TPA: YajQ family cyclic di-GMP-binding protein [Bacteroidota bacterium]|nr:YajQ family cyclic di-GMP-binding protein [Bacteroidota bacterium]